MTVARSALPHTGQRGKWMAELHTAGMQDFMAERDAIRKMDRRGQCARVAAIARKQFPRLVALTGMSDRAAFETGISRALAKFNCPTSSPLSLWASPPSTVFMQGDEVTGAYYTYHDALKSAMLNAYTPDQAAANLDAVVASATDLGPGDYNVLSTLASFGASSGYYWYAVEQAGGAAGWSGYGGGGGGSEVLEMSMFSMCEFWCKVGWSDLGGGLLGAMGGGLVGSIAGALVTSALAAI